jgi:DNA-binding transcriptional MerR regulator
MDTLVGIGDFSKMTYLSIKALRHYHDVGLLEPADVDPATGYRRYTTGQVPVAHAIRRFRDLDMPLEEIREVLQTPDAASNNRLILRHLERMQRQLEQTQRTVASLQEVLSGAVDAEGRVEIRRLHPDDVLLEVATVSFEECPAWLERALGRLHLRAERAGLTVCGVDGALYADAFFEIGIGDVTAFVPVADSAFASGAEPEQVAHFTALTVAQLVHDGPLDDLDRTYGALGSLVAERGIGGTGPIREHYITETRTEVCWPVTTEAEADDS